MRVLLVAPHYPPTFVAGVELYTRRLAGHLAARGHECQVVAVEHLGSTGRALEAHEVVEDGVRVFRLGLPDPQTDERFRATYHDPGLERWLEARLREWRPEVIHLQSGYLTGGAVLAAARTSSVPVIVTLHDYWFTCPRITLQHPGGAVCSGPETPAKCAWCLLTSHRRYRLPSTVAGHTGQRLMRALLPLWPVRALTGWSARVADIETRRAMLLPALTGAARLLSPSRFLRDEMARAGVPADRVLLQPYGVEPRRPALPRSPDGAALRIGFLGQVAAHKGVDVLIAALRRVAAADVELVVRGDLTRDPGYAARLRALAGGDPRVVFGGPLDHADLDDFFASIDILAVPSVWYENSPLVIHEARMAGLPVLTSNLGGMAELVRHDEDGLLATAGEPDSYAAQIRRLAADPALAGRLREGVRPPPTAVEEVSALEQLYATVVREAV